MLIGVRLYVRTFSVMNGVVRDWMKASEMWDIFINIFIILLTQRVVMGRDSSVGIATRYCVDVPYIECRRELNFPHPSVWTGEETDIINKPIIPNAVL